MKYYKIAFLILFISVFSHSQKSDFKSVNFKIADSIADSYQGFRLHNMPLLSCFLTKDLATDVEKVRAIYMWVCNNIESDHYFGEKTIRKRKKFKNDSIAFSVWNKLSREKFFSRLLNHKQTICTGYAYILKELCNLAGLECEIINGYSRTVYTNVNQIDIPNHSWNAVKIGNKWYLADATLASGFFYVNENIFIKNYNDGYFLTSPQLFLKTHYPLEEKWVLCDNDLTLNQFVEQPLIYGSTYKYNVIPVEPSVLKNEVVEGEKISFSVKLPSNFNIDSLQLLIDGRFKQEYIKATANNVSENILTLGYVFNKKGIYDVQITVEDKVVISYTVLVKRGKFI